MTHVGYLQWRAGAFPMYLYLLRGTCREVECSGPGVRCVPVFILFLKLFLNVKYLVVVECLVSSAGTVTERFCVALSPGQNNMVQKKLINFLNALATSIWVMVKSFTSSLSDSLLVVY